MATIVRYRNAGGGGVTSLTAGSPAERAYAKSKLWEEVERVEVDDPAPAPERPKPAERAAEQAAENEAAKAAAAIMAPTDPAELVTLNVGDIKAVVEARGPELAVEVLEAERSGRNRSSLVKWLITQAGDLLVPENPTPEAPADGDEEADPAEADAEAADQAPDHPAY